MATHDEIRGAIQSALAGVTWPAPLGTPTFQTTIDANPNLPVVVIGVPLPTGRETFDSAWTRQCPVTLFAAAPTFDAVDAQITPLADLSGDASMIVALDADPTLGGTVDDSAIVAIEAGFDQFNGHRVAFVTFTLEILDDQD